MCYPRELKTIMSAEVVLAIDKSETVKAVKSGEMSSSPFLSTMDEYFTEILDEMPKLELTCQERSHIEQSSFLNFDESTQQARCDGMRKQSFVANKCQLRIVEGRLQAVGFVGDLLARHNSSRFRRKMNNRQKSFVEQVIFYMMK